MQHHVKLVRRQRSVSVDRVMGIDPSLTSTGWAVRTQAGIAHGTIATKDARGARRLLYARDQLAALLDEHKPTHVAYEDYAMGKARGGQGRIFDIGELGGVYKTLIYERGINLILIAPTSLKRFVTGKGNVVAPKGKTLSEKQKKEPMVQRLRSDFGIHVPQYDEADAAGLLLYGEIHRGLTKPPQDGLISIRLDAVASCTEVLGKLQSISNARK